MSESTTRLILWLIPLAPLASAVVTALLGQKLLRERSHLPCWGALALSAIGALLLVFAILPSTFDGHASPVVATGFEWMSVGSLSVHADVQADAMTALMLAMVNTVSLLVAVFAAGYMAKDPGYPRFFAEVSLFVFSMCMLVLAGNFLLLFVFWEGVGLCSYLLIGYWYQRPSAAAAAKKAFVVNRVGDMGFLIALFLIWTTFGSLDFATVFGRAAEVAQAQPERITLICLLLFLGAAGKSAQFPLHVWLPDAMEGPTPVSALIHAATMVTAGVYLIARCTPLFVLAPTAQLVVASIGAITAFIASVTALTQNDLKRVLAYSTVSQLGYMFMGLGAAAGTASPTGPVIASMFHLFTHAYFKALLFLAAGSVMHAMGDVIDMRRFSGLRRILPITHWTFLCGAAALAGLPLLSGFWSKDDILAALSEAAQHPHHGTIFAVIHVAAVATALLTAFYTFRAYFMTFWGEERIPDEAGHHAHESPPVMARPLQLLAIAAVFIGGILGPTHLFADYFHHTPGMPESEVHGLHLTTMAVSTVVALLGIALAWLFYVKSPALADQAAKIGPLYRLSLNKLYIDEILAVLVVIPMRALAWLSELCDRRMIDGLVDGIGRIPRYVSVVPRNFHNGLVSSYALVMWAGVVLWVVAVIGLLM